MKNHIRFSPFLLAVLFPLSLAAQKKSADTTTSTIGLRPETATKTPAKPAAKTAQKPAAIFKAENYFYGSIKFPTEDLANAISQEANENSDYENKNGLIFDIGYGMPITRFLSLEAGLEALIGNPFQAIIDKPEAQGYGALDIKNRSFALQLRPVFNHNFDEEISLRAGTAVNYRQLNSSGKYWVIQERNGSEQELS